MSGNASVAVARVSKSFGSEGELLVSLFDTFPDDFDLREPLFVEIDRLAVPLFATVSSVAGATERWSFSPIFTASAARPS